LKDVAAVALRLGVSKGKVKKALMACGVERHSTVPTAQAFQGYERDPHDVESVSFDYTGDSTVREAWRDETEVKGRLVRNLWLRSNDGDLVVVPEAAIRRLP
jgi:hypothetical protein